MEFVNKQDAAAFFDLVHHPFQPFLKLAAIFCASNQRAHVKRDDSFALDRIGHFFGHDALRESFGDGGFTHAWLANQGRIILGAARKNLDHALNFVLPTNHRIEATGFGHFGQIGGKRVEIRGFALLCLAFAGSRATAG